MVPFVIVIILVGVLFVTMCVCSGFNKSCPPVQFRRDLKKNPYTMNEFRIITVLSLVFSTGVIIVSLISLSYIPLLKQNVEYTTCGIYISLDSILNG